jgi:hypothetical protein
MPALLVYLTTSCFHCVLYWQPHNELASVRGCLWYAIRPCVKTFRPTERRIPQAASVGERESRA